MAMNDVRAQPIGPCPQVHLPSDAASPLLQFIGKCQVSLEGLGTGKQGALAFRHVSLDGVPSGWISFSVRFELRPVFSLFPGTPLHASAKQALRRRPPRDATRAELARDAVLRFLSQRVWAYAAVVWLCTLVGWIVWIVIIHIGIILPPIVEGGEPEDPRYWPLHWADKELHFWANICFHWTTGLGTYLNTITLPWRLSIALHLWGGGCCSGRSSEPGQDFYGRATEALWFHIPRRPRGVVTFCLLASTFCHYTMQTFRLLFHDYEGLTSTAGNVLVNVPFALSILLAVAGGIVQGNAEKRLIAANPGRWPPGVGKVAKDALQAMRSGELRPCGLRAWLRARKLADEIAINATDVADDDVRTPVRKVSLPVPQRPPGSTVVEDLSGQ